MIRFREGASSLLVHGLLLLLGTGVGLGLCEVSVRALGLSKTWSSYVGSQHLMLKSTTTPDRVGYRRLPGQSWRMPFGQLFHANAEGFRAREFALERQPGRRRIAFLGDSVSEGYGIATDERFPEVAGAWLNAHGTPTETMNFGVSGHATADEFVVLRDRVLQFNPDVVVLQFGFNDIADNTDKLPLLDTTTGSGAPAPITTPPAIPPAMAAGTWRRAFIKSFLQQHSALYLAVAERVSLNRIRAGGSNSILDGVVSTGPEAWKATKTILERLFDLCRERKIRLLVAYLPLDVEVQTPDENKAMLTARTLQGLCAGRSGVEFLDVMGVLRGARDRALYLDDVHLTAYGNKLVGEELGRALGRSGG